jgi:TctA family transporter
MLIGLAAVTTTSDTIPAVLFGVPGTVGSAATTLDGHPMAKKGEAGRAYGAAFTASVVGGLFGALVLALAIPILRPFVLSVGTPELLVICLLGLTLIVTLSHGALFKGLVAASLGLLLATIGDESQTGTLRWTFDSFYLWDGLSLVAVALGLFAIPEMIDLGASKKAISKSDAKADPWQQIQGAKDVVKNWWLVLRCASIGTFLGSIPGIGANVIDWIAYGYASKSIKNSHETFGKGDVRGVIASESANNAKEGGALVPTLVFGVPGSASMAILLGAFLIHGIAPGPNMLGSQLDVTFTLIWTVALANILGAGTCLLLAGYFARLATIRAGFLVPLVIGIMIVGAYQGSKDYADLIVLFVFGILGIGMKRLGWPRPPLILAFVLGSLIENYLFISHLRYGAEWMLRPVPLFLLCIMALMLLAPLVSRFVKRSSGGQVAMGRVYHPRDVTFFADIAAWIGAVALFMYVLWSSSGWELSARMLPQSIAYAGLVFAAVYTVFRLLGKIPRLDTEAKLPLKGILVQIIWLSALVVGVKLVGMLPAIILFAVAYMVIEGETPLKRSLLIVTPYAVALIILFQLTLHVPWPQSLLGDLLPALRSATGRIL